MWRERQNENHKTQSSSWFVTWRLLHNVQTKQASYHAEMPVKNIASKPATGMQGYTIKSSKHLTSLKSVELRSLVHYGINRA